MKTVTMREWVVLTYILHYQRTHGRLPNEVEVMFSCDVMVNELRSMLRRFDAVGIIKWCNISVRLLPVTIGVIP